VSILRLFERVGRVTLELLFSPGGFFTRLRLAGGIQLPLLYAVFTHCIASAASFGWEEAFLKTLKKGASEIFLLLNDAHELGHPGRNFTVATEVAEQFKEQFLTWFWGASAVLLSPFKTLGLLLWATLFLFVASRLLIYPDSSRPVTLRGSFRIACFASTTVLWKLIPLIGPVVAEIMLLVTTVIAVQKSYQISRIRATAIALFPQLLFLGILLAGIAGFAWLVLRAFF
jgi:hypothetical protein